MTLDDYQSKAYRTFSPGVNYKDVYTGRLSTRLNANIFRVLFGRIQHIAEDCNKLKRYLFYGKLPDGKTPQIFMFVDEFASEQQLQLSADDEVRDVLHGILGAQSELGELVEATAEYLQGKITREEWHHKLKVEDGDLGWYHALIASAVRLRLSAVGAANIEKLYVRYPEKFTEECAITRDLEAEDNAVRVTGATAE